MKTTPILIAFISLVFAGCSKHNGNSSPTYYFKFQMNNTTYSFDSVVVVMDTMQGGCAVKMHGLNTKTRSFFDLITESDVPSVEGTYSRINPSPTDRLLMVFSIILYTSTSSDQYGVLSGPFTLAIQNSTANTINGSFSGTVTDAYYKNDTIAKGQFNLPYTYQQ